MNIRSRNTNFIRATLRRTLSQIRPNSNRSATVHPTNNNYSPVGTTPLLNPSVPGPVGPLLGQLAQITDHLYLSGARAVHFSNLVERGITCVINAAAEIPRYASPGVEYVKISADDSPECNLYEYFDLVADKIADVKRNGGKTLVHCVAGISRSATLCIAYLMKYERMSLRPAYELVKARRPIIRPNVGFFKQLIDYENKLFGTKTVQMIGSHVAGFIPDVYDEGGNFVWLATSKQPPYGLHLQ